MFLSPSFTVPYVARLACSKNAERAVVRAAKQGQGKAQATQVSLAQQAQASLPSHAATQATDRTCRPACCVCVCVRRKYPGAGLKVHANWTAHPASFFSKDSSSCTLPSLFLVNVATSTKASQLVHRIHGDDDRARSRTERRANERWAIRAM